MMNMEWQVFCKDTLTGDVVASCLGTAKDPTYLNWIFKAWGWTVGVSLTALVVAGGVAANKAIRAALEQLAGRFSLPFVAPPLWLCTDNAAMIAWAGMERFAQGLVDGLDVPARPRWPLDPEADKVRGAGVKA